MLLLGGDYGEGRVGVRTDTTILMHLSADRKRAYGVSIPRDLMLPQPACDDPAATAPPSAGRQRVGSAGKLIPRRCVHRGERIGDTRLDRIMVGHHPPR